MSGSLPRFVNPLFLCFANAILNLLDAAYPKHFQNHHRFEIVEMLRLFERGEHNLNSLEVFLVLNDDLAQAFPSNQQHSAHEFFLALINSNRLPKQPFACFMSLIYSTAP
jgi:hypothetical protein